MSTVISCTQSKFIYSTNLIQIAYDKQPPKDCEAFVEVNNMITCEKSALLGFLKLAEKQ